MTNIHGYKLKISRINKWLKSHADRPVFHTKRQILLKRKKQYRNVIEILRQKRGEKKRRK